MPPNGKARRETLKDLAAREEAFVLYEAPHRIRELLCDLVDALAAAGDGARRVVVARELTKRFETFSAMTASDLSAWAKMHEPRGEYVIAVDMRAARGEELDARDRTWIDAIAKELPPSRAAAVAARVTGLKRDAIYQMIGGGNK